MYNLSIIVLSKGTNTYCTQRGYSPLDINLSHEVQLSVPDSHVRFKQVQGLGLF